VYDSDEDPTTILDPAPTAILPRRSRFGLRRMLGPRTGIVGTVIVGTVLAAAATGIGLFALTDSGHHPFATPPDQDSAPQGGTTGVPGTADRSAQQAWASQYGQDRSQMPDLPNVAAATPQQQAAAADLLAKTQSSSTAYSDPANAQAGGFDLPATLARTEHAQPKLAQRLARIDGGHHEAMPPVLRVVNKTNTHDGKVLDPSAPEILLYQYQGHNAWKVIGAGYIANESYPQPPPNPGGPIIRWRYDNKHPATLTMDVFFTAANDLAHAYALTPPKTQTTT